MRHKSPNSILEAFVKSLDDNVTEVINKTGIPRRTLYNMFKDGHSINLETVMPLVETYGLDLNALLGTENKSVLTSARHKVLFSRTPKRQFGLPTVFTSADQVNEAGDNWDPEEFVSVPFYPQVYASGGQGLITQNESSLPITFRRYFFTNTIQSSANECFMIRIKGDSMYPLYPDGADLLIDQTRTKIKEGPGFLVRIEDSLYCKLLRKIPGAGIEMRSKNEDYQPVQVNAKEKDFEIIGEVVWHAAKSKYI